MRNKKIFFITIFCLAFIFSVNFVFAQNGPCVGKSNGSLCYMSDGTLGTCNNGDCFFNNLGNGSCAGQSEGASCTMSDGTQGKCDQGYCTLSLLPGSGGGSGASSSSGGGWKLESISTFGLPGGSIMGIAINILLWILRIFGVLGILGFLTSGIIYLTAAGDEERMAYAKRAMQYSILGVIVGLVGFVVIQAIDYALNAYSGF